MFVPPLQRPLFLREMITVYAGNFTRHINILCGVGEDFLVLREMVHLITTALKD